MWLCAVPATDAPLNAAQAALERILPHVGVGRAHIRHHARRALASRPAPTARPSSTPPC